MTRFCPLTLALVALSLRGAGISSCENANAVKVYVEQVDAGIKQIKPRLFVQSDLTAKWHEVKEVPDAAQGLAYVYVDERGTPIGAFFSFSSAAKDWVLFANYYYQADGGLAKKNELLNTSHGRISMGRETLYGCDGEVLKATKRSLDLDTKRKKQPGASFEDESAPEYKRVQDLPFFAELKGQSSSAR